jgi:hypothetical protein
MELSTDYADANVGSSVPVAQGIPLPAEHAFGRMSDLFRCRLKADRQKSTHLGPHVLSVL